MSLPQWFGSNVEYARKLAHSGIEGAGRGREEFLRGERVAAFLTHAARQAVAPAVMGLCVAALGARLSGRHSNRKRKPLGRTLAYGLLGGAIGFGAGVTWKAQGLAASIARRSFENTRPVRDQRWLERNPINYA